MADETKATPPAPAPKAAPIPQTPIPPAAAAATLPPAKIPGASAEEIKERNDLSQNALVNRQAGAARAEDVDQLRVPMTSGVIGSTTGDPASSASSMESPIPARAPGSGLHRHYGDRLHAIGHRAHHHDNQALQPVDEEHPRSVVSDPSGSRPMLIDAETGRVDYQPTTAEMVESIDGEPVEKKTEAA